MKKILAKQLVVIVTICISVLTLHGQDVRFSQVLNNPLKMNPAIMGMNKGLTGILNYRSQWASIDKGYKTYGLTAMYPIPMNQGKGKLDIGLNAFNDKAGAFSNLDISLAVNYNLLIAENHNLSASLTGGYIQKSLDAKGLTFDSQYVLGTYSENNPSSEQRINEKTGVPDVGFGVMWFYNPPKDVSKINTYVGFSMFHVNQPVFSNIKGKGELPVRYSYQTGIKISGEDKLDVMPNIIISSQQNNLDIAAGVYLNLKFNEDMKLIIGAWYRKQDAFPFMVGFEYKGIAIEYSYDMVKSSLGKVLPGTNANEITLSYKLIKKDEKKALVN
ncbi:MAG: PorP/SprF family type IX secretion system membrane protein [Bacteroidia bacterium]|nr:PorP/SprF family type IX secretion system membrane protein [Bacteroidia bacterium]